MRLIAVAFIAALFSVLAASPASAENPYNKKVVKPDKPRVESVQVIPGLDETKKPEAYKKRITYLFPKSYIRKKIRFTPWSNPTKKQTLKIMRIEEGIWGGPSQYDRIYCESKFKSDWVVGQYSGLLMISASWWDYVWPKTPKRIVYKTEHRIDLPTYKITLWSNGKRYKHTTGRKTVRLTRVNIGRLPRHTSATHGWAAIRVGQRAITGGPPATWECSL